MHQCPFAHGAQLAERIIQKSLNLEKRFFADLPKDCIRAGC